MEKADENCEPEWMDAEDPLFILYTRWKFCFCLFYFIFFLLGFKSFSLYMG